MQKLGKLLGSHSGSAIITALVMGVVFSIVALAFVRLTTRCVQISQRDIEAVKCYWANEGFVRLMLRALTLDPGQNGMPERMQVLAIDLSSADLPSGIALNHYPMSSAAIRVEWAGFAPGTPAHSRQVGTYNVECSMPLRTGSGSVKYVTRIDSIVVKSIQRYSFFEDTTAADSVFWREFVVNGDYHCNGIIRLAEDMTGGERVKGKATTSGQVGAPDSSQTNSYVDPYNMGIIIANHGLGSDEDWLKERFPEYGHVGEIQTDIVHPDSFMVDYLKSSTGDTVKDPVAIELTTSGVNYYRKTAGAWQSLTNPQTSDTLVKTWNSATVWGSMTGRRTIVTRTGQDIVIGGQIQVAGGTTLGNPNALALVSGKDVLVPGNFNCTVGTTVKQDYDFTAHSKTLVQASLFCKNGGLRVNIGELQSKAYAALDSLLIEGSVMVRQDVDKIWQFDDGQYAGLKCIYSRDARYYNNEIALPGIKFPKAVDEEQSGTSYMWILATGKWRSRLVVAP